MTLLQVADLVAEPAKCKQQTQSSGEVVKLQPLQRSLYCPFTDRPTIVRSTRELSDLEIKQLEDVIRELCARMLTAEESEIPGIAVDLRVALNRHADQISLMTLKTIKSFPQSKSKAAD